MIEARSEAVHLGIKRLRADNSMLQELQHKRQKIDRIVGSEVVPAPDSDNSFVKELQDVEILQMEAEAKVFGAKIIAGLPPMPPAKLIESLL